MRIESAISKQEGAKKPPRTVRHGVRGPKMAARGGCAGQDAHCCAGRGGESCCEGDIANDDKEKKSF